MGAKLADGSENRRRMQTRLALRACLFAGSGVTRWAATGTRPNAVRVGNLAPEVRSYLGLNVPLGFDMDREVTASHDHPHESEEARSLHASLERLARGEPHDLGALLNTITIDDAVLEGTRASCCCHFLALDGNGRPRVNALVQELCTYVLQYSIPRSQIEEAYAEGENSRSLIRLHNEARSLFTHLANTGEGGELLLFALAESVLQLPQVICKMSLKTNPNVHYHGSDGVHASVDPATNRLCLHWGESKIYRSFADALRECVASLAPYLREEYGDDAPQQRDMQLLRQNVDLADAALEDALKTYLDPTDPQFNELEYRGLALVGFDCDRYPATPNSMTLDELNAQISELAPGWGRAIASKLRESEIDTFVVHCFFVPFPSVTAFRNEFLRSLGLA